MSSYLKSAVIALVATGLGAGMANAALMSGKIEQIYPKSHRIMLGNHLFRVSPHVFHTASLRRGESVRVNYHWQHGHRWVTGVSKV